LKRSLGSQTGSQTVKLPPMAEPKLRRRGHGEDAIYFAASKNRYVGAVSLGFTPDGKRIRRKVSGKTKQEVRDKLKAVHQELDAGVRSPAGYTSRYSTRSLQITRNSLDRAVQHAQANDLVARNVAALVKPPRGRSGRPSKSFTLEQAKALLAVTEGSRWHAYVALSLLAGIRTEEARALRWDQRGDVGR
jgi:integrase